MPPPTLPEEFRGYECAEVATLKDVPTSDALTQWLSQKGLPTDDWGKNNTKTVSKFWDELKLDESGLELWKKPDGSMQAVRVTHVLRAKVCSPESYKRDVFLFNTWQQFGDGRKRTRNGLLSEKLTISEMPLENHLHEVCERAVTKEEMQRISGSVMKLQSGEAPPAYDADYVCPLNVVEEHFIDHTIEMEESKSYPGLLTMYNLYTVDIMCTGLPKVDFNTLEFDHPEKGTPKLKYIHAWAWLSWSDIKRYLFEGSVLKEKKKKGSFADAEVLRKWLTQFDYDLSKWTTDSVNELFNELETEEAQLERWGRYDGVSLLMRVVHVIQIKFSSTDPRHARRILLETGRQSAKGGMRVTNRLPSKKQSTKHLPFDEQRFIDAANEIARTTFKYVSDATYKVSPGQIPNANELDHVEVEVLNARFVEKHIDLQDSPRFHGMHTMYHLYAMVANIDGLPLTSFTSCSFTKDLEGEALKFRTLQTWEWASWEQILDMVHTHTTYLENCKQEAKTVTSRQQSFLAMCSETTTQLRDIFQRYLDGTHTCTDTDNVSVLFTQLQQATERAQDDTGRFAEYISEEQGLQHIIPPSMVAKMADSTLAHAALVEKSNQSNITKAMSRRNVKEISL